MARPIPLLAPVAPVEGGFPAVLVVDSEGVRQGLAAAAALVVLVALPLQRVLGVLFEPQRLAGLRPGTT